jgi:hypothetical protein
MVDTNSDLTKLILQFPASDDATNLFAIIVETTLQLLLKVWKSNEQQG